MRRIRWMGSFAGLVIASLAFNASTAAATVEDAQGREWRQLYTTTGLSWDQVDSVCPRDGVTPCSGTVDRKDLTGWIWGTDAQVLELLSEYAPQLKTTDPPSLYGAEYIGNAIGFLGAMRWTVYHSSNYSYSEYTGGWTASLDEADGPIGAGASWSHPIFSASIGMGSSSDRSASASRGVFLWRTAGLDYSPPVITPKVKGTAGSNGWYVSDVSVTWDVADAESPVDSKTGCDAQVFATDTSSTTVTCRAASVGGPASSSVVVKRDTTAPTVTCDAPVPTFSLGDAGVVKATVADGTSGPQTLSVGKTPYTGAPGAGTVTIIGSDLAGNATTKQCAYNVVVPDCRGLKPTMVGTPGSDVLIGTTKRDIIVAVGGSDTVRGNGGADVICGGDGDDSIEGGKGDDTLDGGAQTDSIRGDAGRDACTSGERRMSSCELAV
jgi:Ca2+-binding RTX toxin-like protein